MAEARRLRMVMSGGALGALPVMRATVRERVSEPTEAVVELHAAGVDPGFAAAIDEEVGLTWTRDDAPVRTIRLRIRGVRYLGVKKGVNVYELSLRSSFDFLKLTKNTRKFRDQSSKEIIAAVLRGKVDVSFELAADPASLPYTVQYRESDFDFVSRLAETDGFFYEATDEDTLVVRDTSAAAAPFRAHAPLSLVRSAGALAHGDEALFALSRLTRVDSGRATVNDYNWKTPAVDLIQSAKGARDELLEVYDYPSGYRTPDQGQAIAKKRVEAFESEKRAIRGQTSFVDLRPCRTISVDHADGIGFSGEYFVTEVTHTYDDVEDARGANRFEAIPKSTPFRPRPVTPRPEVGGYDTAMVRGPVGEEIHTDHLGRCKVQFHWDREAKGTDEDSRWIRVLQETSTSMTLARVGWEVAVTYVDSDPDRPVAIARMINGQMVPTYAQPEKQNVMTIRTETYPGKEGFNEIRLDDTSGAEQMYMFAWRDHAIEVQHDKREWVGHDERVTAGLAVSRHVHKTQKVDIGIDLKRTVDVDENQLVEGNRVETIGGNETISVKNAVLLDVGGTDTEKVGSVRLTIAGGIKPPPNPLDQLVDAAKSALPSKPDPKAALAAAAKQPAAAPKAIGAALKPALPSPESLKASLTNAIKPPSLESLLSGQINRAVTELAKKRVGAAIIALAGGNVSVSAQKILAEVAGGARVLVAAKESLNTNSTGKFVRLVGAMISRKAGKDITTSAREAAVTIGGNATFDAKDKVELRGQKIEITALKSVHLEKGDLKIDMTPSKITITGDMKLKTKDKINVHGTPDNVSK
ncbi:MAG: type VI secretion system tip protein TssI/VgrG [Polyangiaceae bacterium]